MTADDLLAHLAHLGVTVTRTETYDLSLDYPAGALDADLIGLVKAMKPDLLARLATSIPVDRPPVAAGDDGRCVWIRAMGQLLGWPRLPLREAEAIASGEPAWIAFTSASANTEMVDRAVAVLLSVDDPGASLS